MTGWSFCLLFVQLACCCMVVLSLSLLKTVCLYLAAGFCTFKPKYLTHCLHCTVQQQLECIPPRLVATQHNDHEFKLWRNVLQTDGWFSEKSASIYEASTETLFLGRQDAMQRQSLVPLHRFMQTRSPGRHTKGDNTKMLEVACGTGRFATFVKVLHPTNLPFQTFTPPSESDVGRCSDYAAAGYTP